jgi:hypothetical protein
MAGKRNGPGTRAGEPLVELEATFGEAAWSMEFKCDLETIRRRYRWLAPIYPLFEPLWWLPSGVRRRAVDRLKLTNGKCVAEIVPGSICSMAGGSW